MLLAKKCQYFLYLNLIKISLEIMLSDFAEKKETFFDLKKQHFSKSLFSPMLLVNYFLYLPLIKISLEKMLSDFTENKETFFSLSKKAFFSKELTHSFGQKMPVFS